MDAHVHRGALIDTPDAARRAARLDACEAAGFTAAIIGVFTVPLPVTIIAALVLHSTFGWTAVWLLAGSLAALTVGVGVATYRAELRHYAGPCR